MAVALVVIRQEFLRDLVRRFVPDNANNAIVAVVGSACEAIHVIRETAVDIVAMGPTFIEEAPNMVAARTGRIRPMTAVLYSELTPSIAERARLNLVDVLIDASRGVEKASGDVMDAYSKFRSGDFESWSAPPTNLGLCVPKILIHDDFDREIIEMIAAGYGDRDIAEAVFLSHQTVRNRVSRILNENGARNRTHLACMYLKLMNDGRQPFESDVRSVA